MSTVIEHAQEATKLSPYGPSDMMKILIPNIYVTKLIGASKVIRGINDKRDCS